METSEGSPSPTELGLEGDDGQGKQVESTFSFRQPLIPSKSYFRFVIRAEWSHPRRFSKVTSGKIRFSP